MTNWIALAGIGGTVLVGLAGIASTLLAPDWSSRRVEERQDRREFRTARRLVIGELERLVIELGSIAGQDVTFSPEIASLLATPEWDAHKEVLARLLPDKAWVAVRALYLAVDKMRVGLRINHGSPVDDEQRELTRTILSLTSRNIDLLKTVEMRSRDLPQS